MWEEGYFPRGEKTLRFPGRAPDQNSAQIIFSQEGTAAWRQRGTAHCSGDGRAGCGAWGGFPPISCRLTLQLCLRIVHHHIFHSDPKYTFSLGPEISGALYMTMTARKYMKNAEERRRKAQLDHHCTRHWLRPLSWTKLVAIVLLLL